MKKKPDGLICEVCGSDKKVERYQMITPLCSKHYDQMLKYGRIKAVTLQDPNVIVEHKDYAEVVLRNKEGEETGRALIDIEDVEKIRKYKWYMNPKGYAVYVNKRCIQMHRYIANPPQHLVIDHINRNKLDNRKCNLRICTQKENVANSSRHERT